jgi:hypothetical protein
VLKELEDLNYAISMKKQGSKKGGKRRENKENINDGSYKLNGEVSSSSDKEGIDEDLNKFMQLFRHLKGRIAKQSNAEVEDLSNNEVYDKPIKQPFNSRQKSEVT